MKQTASIVNCVIVVSDTAINAWFTGVNGFLNSIEQSPSCWSSKIHITMTLVTEN